MALTIKQLIENKDYEGLRRVLSSNPDLANEGIGLDEDDSKKAHPLHRICDGVFAGKYTEEESIRMAKVFLEFGANIDGYELKEKQDTPLIAAASLYADQLALLYIENGANIYHAGCHGGTALHWAAWCGLAKVVQKLAEVGAEINKRCLDFKSTPLFWAVHGLKHGGEGNKHHQTECVKILLQHGADKTIPNLEGITALELLDTEDIELKELLS